MLITLLFAFVFIAHSMTSSAYGLIVLGEDKRQDQIPLPRIGRAEAPFWIQPYYHPLGPLVGSPTEMDIIDDLLLFRDGRSNWLVPHLGRRKRSLASGPKYSDIQRLRSYNFEDLLRRSPWTILSFKGMDKKMAYNPRLGRAMTPRLGKKSSSSPNESHLVDKKAHEEPDDQVDLESRAAYSPRFGRAGGNGNVYIRASPFAPRLGRSDQSNDDQSKM